VCTLKNYTSSLVAFEHRKGGNDRVIICSGSQQILEPNESGFCQIRELKFSSFPSKLSYQCDSRHHQVSKFMLQEPVEQSVTHFAKKSIGIITKIPKYKENSLNI